MNREGIGMVTRCDREVKFFERDNHVISGCFFSGQFWNGLSASFIGKISASFVFTLVEIGAIFFGRRDMGLSEFIVSGIF